MMPDPPPPLTHGQRDDSDAAALERDRYATTDRADEADPPLFREVNAQTYGDQPSAADRREADPEGGRAEAGGAVDDGAATGAGADDDGAATGAGADDDGLPGADNPAMIALAGAGAANAAGPGLTAPTVGAPIGELATGETDDHTDDAGTATD